MKENELDIMKCEHVIESTVFETSPVDLLHDATDYLLFDFVDDLMDGKIIYKIVELFHRIIDRFKELVNDVKTKFYIKKLQFMKNNKNDFDHYIAYDDRIERARDICNNFNKQVGNLKFNDKDFDAKFDDIYTKSKKQFDDCIGQEISSKKIKACDAADATLKNIESCQRVIKDIENSTAKSTRTINNIHVRNSNLSEEKARKRNIISKITTFNAGCANFISQHPFQQMIRMFPDDAEH